LWENGHKWFHDAWIPENFTSRPKLRLRGLEAATKSEVIKGHPFFSGLSAPFAAVHQEALSQKSTENGENSEPFGHGRRQTSGFFAEENSSGGTEPEYMKKRPSRK